MPAQASLTVVPQAALQAAPPATKRKNREEVEEDDENDSGSDVVSLATTKQFGDSFWTAPKECLDLND